MPSPLMTVSFALPAGCEAPKNIVFAVAAGAGRSIFAPQLPQKRLSMGISAPQLGQFFTAMAASILDVRPPGEYAGAVADGSSPAADAAHYLRASASSAAPRTTACLSARVRSSSAAPAGPRPA